MTVGIADWHAPHFTFTNLSFVAADVRSLKTKFGRTEITLRRLLRFRAHRRSAERRYGGTAANAVDISRSIRSRTESVITLPWSPGRIST